MADIQLETSGKNYLFAVSYSDEYLKQISDAAHSFYRTKIFDDPETLLNTLHEQVPSALVVDAKLKGMSGLDMISKVRGFLSSDQLPIVYTVPQNRIDQAEEARGFSGVEPLEKLKTLLGHRKHQPHRSVLLAASGWQEERFLLDEVIQKDERACSSCRHHPAMGLP